MKKLTMEKVGSIKAPVARVWQVITEVELAVQWQNAMFDGARMEADWRLGGEVLYTDKNGDGMRAVVRNFEPPLLLVVEFNAVFVKGVEDRDPKSASQAWIGCTDTYRLSEKDGVSTLSISSELPQEDLLEVFGESYERGIAKIKEIAELG